MGAKLRCRDDEKPRLLADLIGEFEGDAAQITAAGVAAGQQAVAVTATVVRG